MKLFRLIKKNPSLLKLTIIISFGWFFLTAVAITLFYIDTTDKSEYELNELTNHYTNTFQKYNDGADLLASYFTEHSIGLTETEFTQLGESLFAGDSTVTSINFAPSGVVRFVYPASYSDDIGYDIMQNASIYTNGVLLNSIEDHSISYQYNIEDEKVEEILIRKPVFTDDVFVGFVTLTIDRDAFGSEEFVHESTFLHSAIYNEDGVVIYGADNYSISSRHELNIDGVVLFIGENIQTNYILYGTSYLIGYILIYTLFLLIGYIILFKVFSGLNKSTDELEYRKNYDVETGLRNVDKLYNDVSVLIDAKQEFYLSFLNVNNVKYINEKFGHKQTSELISKTSNMITRVLRNNSILYRYGGDEYVLVTKTDSMSEIKNLLRRIVKIFESDIVSGSIRTRLGLSIGVASYPKHGYSTEELIKNAHITSGQVSKHDKEGFQFYHSDRIESHLLNEDFDKMVSNLNLELFEVFLMPIVDVQTNKIAGFECLTRAYDDLGKRLNTEDVVLSLERNGKIQILDEFVFRKMLLIMKRLNKEFPKEDFFLSLNASALSLNDEYVNNIIKMYQAAKLKSGQIVLELTESYQVEDYDYLIELFKKINSHGIKIGIDDFGSGYSSISYLAKFPVYALKIDKQYVQDYDSNEFNKTLLKTLISISVVLECKLVAEGVDNQDTLEYLKGTDCRFYQGYLFSKGVPFDDALALIKNNLPKKKSIE